MRQVKRGRREGPSCCLNLLLKKREFQRYLLPYTDVSSAAAAAAGVEPRHKKRRTYLEKGGRRCSTHRRVEGVALHRHSYCHSSARRLLLHTFGISPLSSASFFLASKNFLADEREGGGGGGNKALRCRVALYYFR